MARARTDGTTWEPGVVLEVEVERLVASGAGLARADGRVVFVAGGLPGDTARVRLVRVARRHAEAEVLTLLAPSPRRTAPRCVHAPTCGGCALQDLEPAAQLDAKRGIVLDALRSIAGLRAEDVALELVPSPPYGWRARAELHVVREPGAAPALGYLQARSHARVPVEECPVLVPALEAELRRLVATPGAIPAEARRAHLAAGDGGVAVAFDGQDGALAGDEPEVEVRVAGFDLAFGARSFFQANRALLEALVERATRGAAGGLALDLYAGSGLFSLPLARAFDAVLAVEAEASAVERLRANARRARRENVEGIAEDVARWLRKARRLEPAFVLLDPPRAGAGPEVVEGVAALAPGEVRYVSCDPGTLARDLKAFGLRGFALERLSLLDLFPHTPHVECVAVLRR